MQTFDEFDPAFMNSAKSRAFQREAVGPVLLISRRIAGSRKMSASPARLPLSSPPAG